MHTENPTQYCGLTATPESQMRQNTERGVDVEALSNIPISNPVTKDDDVLMKDTQFNVSR